ncbi:hypothetical protein M569_03108, partial [Genlisea aurea]
CFDKYIFIHEIPRRFNYDYLYDCKYIVHRWHDTCASLDNEGLGQPFGNSSTWFATNQHSLEVIFHNRIKRYRCLTTNPLKAAAFYAPYYPGLDFSRYMLDSYNTSVRDADHLDFLKFLRAKPEWNHMGGKDHFMVTGRPAWDFHRLRDDNFLWGNNLMLRPESRNMTIVTTESGLLETNLFAIPRPTFFHPSNDKQVYNWMKKVRAQKRSTLFAFVGAPRLNLNTSIRSELMEQCNASKNACEMLDCSQDLCFTPQNVMNIFLRSVFCLQPSGDSPTRRSTFDSIVGGCIPVFFSRTYEQYLWHLPQDIFSYSVIIPDNDIKEKLVNIESILREVPNERVLRMREVVISTIPRIIYRHPKGKFDSIEDAFDVTIRKVIERIESLKQE